MPAIVIEPTAASTVLHRTVDHHPTFIERAQGCYLYPEDPSSPILLDGCGGAAVISIGHGDARVIQALTKQMNTVSYLHSGAFANRAAEELADLITDNGTTFARALFHCGGTEAAESAIKLARQYHVENGQPERVNFIGREQSYHGNSVTALALARHTSRRKPYLPLMNHERFHSVSPCYKYRHGLPGETDEQYVVRLAAELEAKFQELGPGTVAAFFLEPIVGASTGCTPSVPGYLLAMREVCDRHGALLCFDEIMCGMGRSGMLHAWQHHGVAPDIQTCGKALGGGYAAISAVLVSKRVVDVFSKGSGIFNNGYTYQSHAVSCRAGIEVIKILREENLIAQCASRGKYLLAKLHEKLDNHPNVGDIRGQGLFVGVELVSDKTTKTCFPVSFPISNLIGDACMSNGLVVYPSMKGTANGISGDHMLIAPPYIITEEQIDFLVDALAKAIDAGVSACKA